MTKDITLLPPSSTPWEVAESLVSAERRPLDASIIRRLWNPWTCPEEYLPFLAWGLGLEIWNDKWSLDRKREVVAKIWQLKRLKTTPEGIREYLGLVDAEPIRFRRPKDRMWWVPSMTKEELDALMAKMPEIRLYPHHNTPLGWRATYVQDGIETEVLVTGFKNAVTPTYIVSIVGRDKTRSFYNSLSGWPQFRLPSDAETHLVTIQPVESGLEFAVPPGLSPIQVRPKWKSDPVSAPVYKAWHYPSFKNFSFYIPSDAADHLYMSFHFLQPDKIGTFGRPMSFWTWSKSGMPLFKANVTTRIPTHLPDWAFRHTWGVGFWNPSNVDRLWDALAAITIAQAARDEIWVALGRYEPLLFSETLWFNEFEFGDYKEVW